jgi:hypothetical protein
MAHSSLRFGIGRFTTEAEIDFVIKHIVGTVKKLRDMRYVVRYATRITAAHFRILKSVVGNGSRRH